MERCSRSRGPNLTANWLIQKSGGAEGSRTPDLLIANETLYQLSYDPAPIDSRTLAENRCPAREKTRKLTAG